MMPGLCSSSFPESLSNDGLGNSHLCPWGQVSPTRRAAFRVDGAEMFGLKGEASVPIVLCETTSGRPHTPGDMRETTEADICPGGGMS